MLNTRYASPLIAPFPILPQPSPAFPSQGQNGHPSRRPSRNTTRSSTSVCGTPNSSELSQHRKAQAASSKGGYPQKEKDPESPSGQSDGPMPAHAMRVEENDTDRKATAHTGTEPAKEPNQDAPAPRREMPCPLLLAPSLPSQPAHRQVYRRCMPIMISPRTVLSSPRSGAPPRSRVRVVDAVRRPIQEKRTDGVMGRRMEKEKQKKKVKAPCKN
ncbi:hypothetical protein BT67DRAFT_102659 [Trichocladium antarcticum]|uniref:Uncharacterized protein n=1 Tax=Trichocladium antarcticum TaxID=1450529 RepID=A0AAN6ZH31_9PEZI|nr:hypothetical protein BT67DRAFT_102659 [Trichocladium antarcticum]